MKYTLALHLKGFGDPIEYTMPRYKKVQDLAHYPSNNLSNYTYLVKTEEGLELIKESGIDAGQIFDASIQKEFDKFVELVENPSTIILDDIETTPIMFNGLAYRFAIGTKVFHKGSGKTGEIRNLVKTDNGKQAAYKVYVLETGKVTKWSESRVQVKEAIEIPTIEEFDPFENIDGPYKKGDLVTLISLDEARKSSQWINSPTLDVPSGWGGSLDIKREVFGTTVKIVKDHEHSCVIRVDIKRSVNKCFIAKITREADATIIAGTRPDSAILDDLAFPEPSPAPGKQYTAYDNLPQLISQGDTIKIHSLDFLLKKYGKDSSGNPKVSVEWDTSGEMRELCDKKLKVNNVGSHTVAIDGGWSLSHECFIHLGYSQETGPEAKPYTEEAKPAKPKPKVKWKYKVGDKIYRGIKGSSTYDEAIITKLRTSTNGRYPFYDITGSLNGLNTTGWDETKILGIVLTPPEPTYEDMSPRDEVIAMMPIPILLEGPVGSGKSTLLMEIAKDLGLRYFAMVMSDATNANEFKGYKNVVDGSYVAPEFRDAFENGGMYVLEELNATTSNMPIIFNSIENGYFVFADKLVYAHPDFRLCATMNTITNAKEFGGRRTLDKSVDDRFHTIKLFTDFKLRFTSDIIWLRDEVAFAIKAEGNTRDIGPRDLTKYIKLVEKGSDPVEAIIKTMDRTGCLKKSFLKDLVKKMKEH